MKILICPDSYKGTMTAPEAAEAIRRGVREAVPEAETVLLPVGDGGEGTVEAIAINLPGAERIECDTVDALRRPVRAPYVVSGGTTAFMESAAASGLTLLKPEERDVMRADTFGTGLMIADAYSRGIREFVVGMGGTASCDGGRGALEVLEEHNITEKLADARFTLLCDVDNPLCGPRGAAAVFAPQKGATPDMIPVLDGRLRALAGRYQKFFGMDVTEMRHAGAAGGLAGMLMACFRAAAVPGIGKVLEFLDFDSFLEGADLVVTGEGRVDATTLSGKAPKGILDAAMRRGVPVAVIGGCVADRDQLLQAGFAEVLGATPDGASDPKVSQSDSVAPYTEYLSQAAARLLSSENMLKKY